MKDKTPYEGYLSEQLGNLPLPSEDAAWDQMRSMLEEEEDDRPLIPFFRKGCLPGLLILLLLLGGVSAYLLLNREKHNARAPENSIYSDSNRNVISNAHTGSFDTEQNIQSNPVVTSDSTTVLPQENSRVATVQSELQMQTAEGNPTASVSNYPGEMVQSAAQTAGKPTGTRSGAARKQTRDNRGKSQLTVRPARTDAQSTTSKDVSVHEEVKVVTDENNESGDVSVHEEVKVVTDENNESGKTPVDDKLQPQSIVPPAQLQNLPDTIAALDKSIISSQDSVPMLQEDLKDSLSIAQTDSTPPPNPDDSTKIRKRQKTPFTFAAGLAVYQMIPLDGEKAVPYDIFGRERTLGDYIPAVFFRAKKPKWFIETQFRYGAPNSVKEFVYRSKTGIDTFQLITTTTHKLRKTFYHQVPLTFHYQVLKNLSIGTGIAYNKFTRAVRLEEVRFGVPGTTMDTVLSSRILQDGNDSAFVNHSLQWLADIRFNYKRFSLGLRYARALQPYIRYIDPATNAPAEKKNHSLNVYLLFDIWRSKQK